MTDLKGHLFVENALIFDGYNEQLTEGSILIQDGFISEVGKIAKPGYLEAAQCLDVKGKVVTPGFIDNHFHAYGIDLNMMTMEGRPKSFVALKGRFRLEEALKRGFTTVRDVAGGDIGLAMAIKQGLVKSPNYYYTGPALSQTGGHGDPRDATLDLCCADNHGVEVVDGVDNLIQATRERLRKGAHAIKIMASGGVVSLTDPIAIPQYSAEEVRAVTSEANRRGSYVCAHAYSPEAIIHSVRNGVRSIEHANLLDEASADEMVKFNAVMVPTLVTYKAMAKFGRDLGMSDIALGKNAQVLDSGLKAIELAMSKGISVGFGSDLMGDLEYMQLDGLEVQHEAQGTLELLRSITSRNAEILSTDKHGWIKPNMTGDLVVLAENPFKNASALWTENDDRLVVKSGSLAG
jgi:imidazolonepropionase-like amidohydrolase